MLYLLKIYLLLLFTIFWIGSTLPRDQSETEFECKSMVRIIFLLPVYSALLLPFSPHRSSRLFLTLPTPPSSAPEGLVP